MRKVLSLVCVLASLTGAKAASITWGAQIDVGLATSLNNLLPANSLVQIGIFPSLDLVGVQALSGDLNALRQNFVTLDSTRVGNNLGGADGYFAKQFDVNTQTAVNPSFGGKLLYMFAYQSTSNSTLDSSLYTATRVALFTLNTSSWILPTDPAVGAPGLIQIDLNQLTNSTGNGDATALASQARVVLGTFPVAGGGLNNLGLVSVPEPSSAVLLGLGFAGLLGFRRRSAR